jgi:SAM-dependent methyltransferase
VLRFEAIRAKASGAAFAFFLTNAPDTRERHTIVGHLSGKPQTVLDAGGVPGLLSRYLPRRTRIVTANVDPPADLLVRGVELPVEDASFDLVTSIDVLEHIPPDDRPAFIGELVRATKRRVVLCCPLGSPEHQAAEAELLEWYERVTGEHHQWLAEHVQNGLPTDDELRAAFAPWTNDPGTNIAFSYHGDFRRSIAQLKEATLAMGNGVAAKAALAMRWLGHRKDLRLASQPTVWTNRVFVRLERDQSLGRFSA